MKSFLMNQRVKLITDVEYNSSFNHPISSFHRLSPHFTTKINRGDPSLLSNNHLNDNDSRTHKEEWFV